MYYDDMTVDQWLVSGNVKGDAILAALRQERVQIMDHAKQVLVERVTHELTQVLENPFPVVLSVSEVVNWNAQRFAVRKRSSWELVSSLTQEVIKRAVEPRRPACH